MSINGVIMKKQKCHATIKRAAMAALITGIAPQLVQAAVVGEPPDMSNSAAAPTVLAPGVFQVSGSLEPADQDHFRFTGLPPGRPYTLTLDYVGVPEPVQQYLDGSFVGLANPFPSASYDFSGNVGTGGMLTVGLVAFEDVYSWSATLAVTRAAAPVSGTLALAGLGMLVMATTRRRRQA